MIAEGEFHAALNAGETLLNRLGLLRERNAYHRRRLGAAELAGLDYVSMWERLITANDYDIRLMDDSVMLFWRSTDGLTLRYCWFESPRSLPPFDEYARAYLGDVLQDDMDVNDIDQLLSECEFEIQQAFEEERKNAALRDAVTPLRYEFSPRDYTEGVHPASHLHVGISNEIRFACRRMLNPMSFVLLVMRQAYPELWLQHLRNLIASEHAIHVRERLPIVSAEHWNELDDCEMRFE